MSESPLEPVTTSTPASGTSETKGLGVVLLGTNATDGVQAVTNGGAATVLTQVQALTVKPADERTTEEAQTIRNWAASTAKLHTFADSRDWTALFPPLGETLIVKPSPIVPAKPIVPEPPLTRPGT